MADETPRILDDTHATMAAGYLGVALAQLADPHTGLAPIPEPAEFLAAWQSAVAATRADAERVIREQRKQHRELARSVADVTEQGREPTEVERIEIEAMTQAHYEAYQRLTNRTADWETFDPAQKGIMAATFADLVRAGVLVPGPATAAEPAARFEVFTPEERVELAIALDHRLAEAERGNAYVRYETAKALEEQVNANIGDEPRERYTEEELADIPRRVEELELYVVCTNRPGPGVAALIREAVEGTDDHTQLGQVLGKIIAGAEGASEFVELEDEKGSSCGPKVGVDWHEHPQGGDFWRLGPFRPPTNWREHRLTVGDAKATSRYVVKTPDLMTGKCANCGQGREAHDDETLACPPREGAD